eukprot:363682-Chlamydomonas_euryale.AAC.2
MKRSCARRGGSDYCCATLSSVRPVAGSDIDPIAGLVDGDLCTDCVLAADNVEARPPHTFPGARYAAITSADAAITNTAAAITNAAAAITNAAAAITNAAAAITNAAAAITNAITNIHPHCPPAHSSPHVCAHVHRHMCFDVRRHRGG